MGTATAEQTKHQLELTRRSLTTNVDRLVAKVRAELDVKARLRRDGAQIAAIGGGIVATAVLVVVLRRRFGRKRKDGYAIDDFSSMNLGDIAKELKAMRQELEKQRDGGGGPIMKMATAAVAAAAGAAGRTAAARLVGEDEPGAKPDGGPH